MLCLVSQSLYAQAKDYNLHEVDKIAITSPCGTAKLEVSLMKVKEEDLRVEKQGENEEPKVWLGKRSVSSTILWHRKTLIKSFELTIDGKKVAVPKQFYDDIAGLTIRDIVNNKKGTEEQEFEKMVFLREVIERPSISRTAGGTTVLISWGRSED